MKIARILLVGVLLLGVISVAFAAEFYVIKDPSGKMTIVENRPADGAVIVKGPFSSRKDAEAIINSPVPGGLTPAPAPAPATPVRPGPPPPPPPPAR